MNEFRKRGRTGWALLLAVLLAAPAAWGGPSSESEERTVDESGRTVTREFDLRGFDSLDISAAFEVDLRQEDTYSVVVRIDEAFLSDLRVVMTGSLLRIGFRPGLRINTRGNRPYASVSLPDLKRLELSGAALARLADFRLDRDLELALSGASSVEGALEARDLRIEASGASDLLLRGAARDLELDGSGASTIELEELEVQDARVELSGASSATVLAAGRLDLQASGASHLYYLGSPTMGKIETSGASSIGQK